MKTPHQQIAILDFGSQYTHLIARRFREIGVLSRIYPANQDLKKIDNLIGIVLSGGPGTVGDQQYEYQDSIFELGLPILGLCFGHQLMAQVYGGKLETSGDREYGQADLNVSACDLFNGLDSQETVWMSHGDCVVEIPDNWQVLGTTSDKSIAAMGNDQMHFYGLQFHPEVTHTTNGIKILENFAQKICGAQGDWDTSHLLDEVIEQVKEQTKNKKIFLLVSGGVDSSVAFALLQKAIGHARVYGLYIDTGLMRKNETQEIKKSLSEAGFENLHVKNASKYFINKLEGVVDPEEKRKIIGQAFLDIKDQVTKDLKLNREEWLLGQGTIYPDTIETGGTKHADTIKTHHNRIDALQEMLEQGLLVEPIKDFYKDEVRKLGKELGLTEQLINRHPFPGPGLGIRLLCSNGVGDISTKELERVSVDINNFIKTDSSIEDVYVLPIKSVGVQGDFRTYAHPAVLKVQDYNLESLGKISATLTNKIKSVNRVLLELSGSGDDRSLNKRTVTQTSLETLREIDAVVNKIVKDNNLYDDIWQFPVVLIPYGCNKKNSIVLRPVTSLEAMTARFYKLPKKVITEIVQEIEKLGKISHIFLDLTNKPPGTIEWE